MNILMDNPELGRDEEAAPTSTEAFARQVAHDLRNVINNIGLNVQQLELTLGGTDLPVGRPLERMRGNLAQLERLANDIVARAQSLEP